MRASVSTSRSSDSRNRKLVQSLLRWYRRHRRDLPWRGTRDPYRVWVSEIMLQQTRVATVIPYYERFLKRFPSVESLAKAREQTLLGYWSGLGYYRRARMMQAAARKVVSEHGGVFPKSFEELRDLPGIGDYTAAAVASIAFEQPCAVVDGNVIRLLTRLDDDSREVTSSAVRRDLQTRAQQLIAAAGPRSRGAFNQAMMELGSLLCTRRKPRCLICPLATFCKARKNGVQEQRPVRPEKRRPVRLQLAVALVERGKKILLGAPREDPISLAGGLGGLKDAGVLGAGGRGGLLSSPGHRTAKAAGFRHVHFSESGVRLRGKLCTRRLPQGRGKAPEGCPVTALREWPTGQPLPPHAKNPSDFLTTWRARREKPVSKGAPASFLNNAGVLEPDVEHGRASATQ